MIRHSNRITAIITTKSNKDFDYICDFIVEKYNYDISNSLPVFLNIKDFDITHDSSFKAADILTSWWQYNKIPILIVKKLDDLDNLPDGQRDIIESFCPFVV